MRGGGGGGFGGGGGGARGGGGGGGGGGSLYVYSFIVNVVGTCAYCFVARQ